MRFGSESPPTTPCMDRAREVGLEQEPLQTVVHPQFLGCHTNSAVAAAKSPMSYMVGLTALCKTLNCISQLGFVLHCLSHSLRELYKNYSNA